MENEELMSAAERIRHIAMEIRDGLQSRVPRLQRDLERMETHKREIEAQIDAANAAVERAVNFAVKVDQAYPCPFCWMHHGERAMLEAVGGAEDAQHHFRCPHCQAQITIDRR